MRQRLTLPLLALAGLLASALLLPRPGQADEGPAHRLANSLLSTIEPGQRIAVRPFRGSDSTLSAATARVLYERVLDGLFTVAGPRYPILPRERLAQVYQSCEEFFTCGDRAERLEAARADIEIQCTAAPRATEVELFCSAIHLATATTAGRGSATFPRENLDPSLDWQEAVLDLAWQLDAAIVIPGEIQGLTLIDQGSGRQSPYAEILGNQLRFDLSQRMTERRSATVDQVKAAAQLGGSAGEKSLPVDPAYGLRGVLWPSAPDRLTLSVEARYAGRTIALAQAELNAASLPIKPETSSMARQSVRGEAQVSDLLDARAAFRAARNLARSRLVALETGGQAPPFSRITTEAEAALTLTAALATGIPYDEDYQSLLTPMEERRVLVELTGRVRRLDPSVQNQISASLDKPVYAAGAPIHIRLTAQRPGLHIGIFAWGADNSVVRLYPSQGLSLSPTVGETLSLPRPSEGRQIASAPLPSETGKPRNREDHEWILVIASAGPIRFGDLAQPSGSSVADTLAKATPAADFLHGLATLPNADLSVAVLPYQVIDR